MKTSTTKKQAQHNNTGSCLCGKITFTVEHFLPRVAHCHCKMCQKFHGAAFSTFVEVKLSDLHWLTGEKLLCEYIADNESVRKFCGCCGSSLVFESKYNRLDNTIELALSCFDHIEQQQMPCPDAHIYTESKVSWLNIKDELPQFQHYRDVIEK